MILTEMLVSQAHRTPDKVFVRTAEGDLTYAEVLAQTEHMAAGLASLGVHQGEPVAVLMNNSAKAILVWFAINRLGAIHVPINTALVGAGLAHTFRTTGARFTIADKDLAHLVPQATTTLLRDVPMLDEPSQMVVPPELDPAIMLFTSGTTGVSKACVLSHRYVVRQGQIHAHYLGLTSEDVLYCPFPLFHVDAVTLTVMAALAVGATAAIGVRFSASGFWDEVRKFEATVFNFMGATLTILWKQPERPEDRDHRVRLAWGVPMPAWHEDWEKRFGFRVYEIYGLTDGGIVAYDPLDTSKREGTCGRVIPEFDVVVDAPAGEVGEILIRGREPGLVMNEYYGMPEATAKAFKDGFLHTGDLGRLADGYLTFVGRAKDCIRRRGENISAYEVEQVVESHPGVLECAAIGVPSELSEEDVKVCVVPKPGSRLTAEELIAHCAANSARFMVPRYVEFLPELPKTPTEKVEKFRLRYIPASAA